MEHRFPAIPIHISWWVLPNSLRAAKLPVEGYFSIEHQLKKKLQINARFREPIKVQGCPFTLVDQLVSNQGGELNITLMNKNHNPIWSYKWYSYNCIFLEIAEWKQRRYRRNCDCKFFPWKAFEEPPFRINMQHSLLFIITAPEWNPYRAKCRWFAKHSESQLLNNVDVDSA